MLGVIVSDAAAVAPKVMGEAANALLAKPNAGAVVSGVAATPRRSGVQDVILAVPLTLSFLLLAASTVTKLVATCAIEEEAIGKTVTFEVGCETWDDGLYTVVTASSRDDSSTFKVAT